MKLFEHIVFPEPELQKLSFSENPESAKCQLQSIQLTKAWESSTAFKRKYLIPNEMKLLADAARSCFNIFKERCEIPLRLQ